MVKIYYIPFNTQTYIPVTTDRIVSAYLGYGEVTLNNKEFLELILLLKPFKAGTFDKYMVRVKIEFPNGKEIFLDSEGGVSSSSGGMYSLNNLDETKIVKLLEKLTINRLKFKINGVRVD